MDWQVLIRLQPPQVRVRSPVQYPHHLPQKMYRGGEDLLDSAFQAALGQELFIHTGEPVVIYVLWYSGLVELNPWLFSKFIIYHIERGNN
ncbi:uncharacterized protein [Malus domestica]